MAVVAKDNSFVEVHKYRAGATVVVAAVALFLQTFLPQYIPYSAVVELPLLVTIYFSLGRRNPSSGLLLGGAIGLFQDALSHLPLGVYGIALTVVGFASSWIGYRVDVEHALGRFGLTFLLYGLEQVIIEGIRRFLLQQTQLYFPHYWIAGALATSILAVFVFPQLDRLRKT